MYKFYGTGYSKIRSFRIDSVVSLHIDSNLAPPPPPFTQSTQSEAPCRLESTQNDQNVEYIIELENKIFITQKPHSLTYKGLVDTKTGP
jgi:hypothetical protein